MLKSARHPTSTSLLFTFGQRSLSQRYPASSCTASRSLGLRQSPRKDRCKATSYGPKLGQVALLDSHLEILRQKGGHPKTFTGPWPNMLQCFKGHEINQRQANYEQNLLHHPGVSDVATSAPRLWPAEAHDLGAALRPCSSQLQIGFAPTLKSG